MLLNNECRSIPAIFISVRKDSEIYARNMILFSDFIVNKPN